MWVRGGGNEAALRRALADALAEVERLRRELTALRAVCAASLTGGDELAQRRTAKVTQVKTG